MLAPDSGSATLRGTVLRLRPLSWSQSLPSPLWRAGSTVEHDLDKGGGLSSLAAGLVLPLHGQLGPTTCGDLGIAFSDGVAVRIGKGKLDDRFSELCAQLSAVPNVAVRVSSVARPLHSFPHRNSADTSNSSFSCDLQY